MPRLRRIQAQLQAPHKQRKRLAQFLDWRGETGRERRRRMMNPAAAILTIDWWVALIPSIITAAIIGGFTTLTNYMIMRKMIKAIEKKGSKGS